MVDTQNIIHVEGIPHAAHPPVKAGLAMVIPAIKRVAPQLAGSGEAIRRTACHSNRIALVIQLEQLRMRPYISTVHGNINRNIAYNLNALAVGIVFQVLPLAVKLVLQELLELNIKVKLVSVMLNSVAIAELDILRPLVPALAAEEILQCHEQGIVFQPPGILIDKTMKIAIIVDMATLISLAEQRIASLVQLGIVNIVILAAKINSSSLLCGQQPLTGKPVQADEVWIACKGRKRLIR